MKIQFDVWAQDDHPIPEGRRLAVVATKRVGPVVECHMAWGQRNSSKEPPWPEPEPEMP